MSGREGNVIWEEVTLGENKRKREHYSFEMAAPTCERRRYVWKRERWRHWNFVDERSGQVRARYVNDGAKHWYRTGRFDFDEGLGGEGSMGECLCLVAMLGIVKKARRSYS